MEQHRPSATAQKVAIRRAAHQLLDDPKVFDDPLAVPIIGPRARAYLESGRFQTQASRYLRAFVAARSRYAQDELDAAVKRGVRQCVVLGAGLDTFAYRNPYSELKVYEVDHPATQAWKRERLKLVGIGVPESVAYAPVNFENETLAEGLARTRFQFAAPAFFSWLGVTPYLECETTLKTLAILRSYCSENQVVFDFAVPRSSLDPGAQAAFDLLSNRVAAVGEPFQGFFDPKELTSRLTQMGYTDVQDLPPDAINERYFQARSDGLQVGGSMAHLASARG
jgi:methyltransferase (TIGR00027 family)